MSPGQTRVFETDPTAAKVDADLTAYVALAVAITARPETVTPAAIAATTAVAQSPREYLDAVGVMFAFNFVTRVANALGVVPEIPGWMRRVEWLRQLGLRSMAVGFRATVDLRPRRVPGPSPEEHLAGLERLFADLGGGPVPAWFARLVDAPPVLATARECLEALVRRGGPPGTLALDREWFLAVGRIVLKAVPKASDLAEVLPDERETCRDAVSHVVARFVQDMNLRSWAVTAERIDELRAEGLGDAGILDLVVSSALWNAVARLELLLRPLSTSGRPIEVPHQVVETQ